MERPSAFRVSSLLSWHWILCFFFFFCLPETVALQSALNHSPADWPIIFLSIWQNISRAYGSFMVHTAYRHINSSKPVLFAALHAHALLVCFGTWAAFLNTSLPIEQIQVYLCLFWRRTTGSLLWCSYSWTIHGLISSMSCIYIPGGMSGLYNCNLWLHLITLNKRILFIHLVSLNSPDFEQFCIIISCLLFLSDQEVTQKYYLKYEKIITLMKIRAPVMFHTLWILANEVENNSLASLASNVITSTAYSPASLRW